MQNRVLSTLVLGATLGLGACTKAAQDSRAEADADADSGGDSGGDSGEAKPTIPDGFVLIPAGTFEMGCTSEQETTGDCERDEHPVHEVTLTRDYLVSITEVTQDQYLALIGESPSSSTDCGGDCPVEDVDWHMAAAYANALSASEGLTSCYVCSGSGEETECEAPEDPYACEGYRLGTEAEWENAARCGEGTVYAGSDDPDLVAWTHENSGSITHPVATLAPNTCGLYDMSGNVWEWVHDGYADQGEMTASNYPEGSVTDPSGDNTASRRVARGGSFLYTPSYARVSSRYPRDPDTRRTNFGFRLFRTMP